MSHHGRIGSDQRYDPIHVLHWFGRGLVLVFFVLVLDWRNLVVDTGGSDESLIQEFIPGL